MKKKIHLVSSGISFIDKTWGGLYKAGAYLLVGPHKSGKTLFALQFTQEAMRNGERCLYFTVLRPKDLIINAASINFDLQSYIDKDQAIIMKVNLPDDNKDSSDPDANLSEYLTDMVNIVKQYQPNRIIFDELTPFVNYNDVKQLKKVFIQTIEAIEGLDITSIFVIGQPATSETELILNTLSVNATGLISLKKEENEEQLHYGMISIIPNIGHSEGLFEAPYFIEPYKGLVVDFVPEAVQTSEKKPGAKVYKSLTEIDVPHKNFAYTNFYDLNEFLLILNNQIAYYKSTGEVFTLVAFKLDKNAETRGLLTLNQLKNAVRLAIDKKDKICVTENKVVVLLSREDEESVKKLIPLIKENLPGNDSDYINTVSQYISVFFIQVSEVLHDADEMLERLRSDQPASKNNFGSY